MFDAILWSFGLLFVGCFNATAAQDPRINAGKVFTQLMFWVPTAAALVTAAMAHIVLFVVVGVIAGYLWYELT
jgi:hypothetical protein